MKMYSERLRSWLFWLQPTSCWMAVLQLFGRAPMAAFNSDAAQNRKRLWGKRAPLFITDFFLLFSFLWLWESVVVLFL